MVPHLLVQRLDLGPHLHPELGVEVRERLVEQEDRRVAHDGAAHRDALALAAGELRRPPVEDRGHLEERRRLVDPPADFGSRGIREILQVEPHVLAHGHVRVERVVLEHHRHVAVLGVDLR